MTGTCDSLGVGQVGDVLEAVAVACERGIEVSCDVEVASLSPAVKGLFLLAYQVSKPRAALHTIAALTTISNW
jgi:hypothetical protein